jgi:hypothetical protein
LNGRCRCPVVYGTAGNRLRSQLWPDCRRIDSDAGKRARRVGRGCCGLRHCRTAKSAHQQGNAEIRDRYTRREPHDDASLHSEFNFIRFLLKLQTLTPVAVG